MPSTTTPTLARPGLQFWIGVTAALSVFGLVGTVALLVIDANYVDLPNPMVTAAGLFTVTFTLMCVMLGLIRTVLVAGVANTKAAVAAVTTAHRDLKDDTGGIPGLAEAIRQPDIIVLERAVHRVDQVDRETVMRVLREAEAHHRLDDAEAAEVEYAERYREMTQPATPTRPRLVPDAR